MSSHVEYRCDICATPGQARSQRYAFGPTPPKGWKHYGDKDLCSYDCLIKHIEELRTRDQAAAFAARMEGNGEPATA